MSVCLIIGGSHEAAARVEAAINHPTVVLPAESVSDDALTLLRGIDPDHMPEAVILMPSVPVATALTVASAMTTYRPETDVVLIAAAEKEIMQSAMRAGVRDVAPSVEDAGMLQGLRDRLASRSTTPRAQSDLRDVPSMVKASKDFRSRTIVVASPKGGVGKTSVSTNLAVALAQHAPMDVVVVDLDLQFGDVSTVLDLKPTHTLEDAFRSAVNDNLLLKTYLTVHEGHFFVLCGAESPAANDSVTGEQVTALVKQLQNQFKYIIIDTAAGLGDATLGALEAADDVVLVSSMDLAALRSMRKEVELLTELDLLPPSRHVVLNFADKQSGLRVKDVEAMLGVPVDFVLPRSKEVPVAANRGVPVLIGAKTSGFAKAVKSVGHRIVERSENVDRDKTKGHKRLEVA